MATSNISSDLEISDACELVSDVPIQCEILCFMQEKSNIMAVDHIVKLCADFYTKDEVLAAKKLIDPYLSQRLPGRRGSDAERATVEDILKVCLNPHIKLPIFYARSLHRLPPVDSSHCDVSAILQELQLLRMEVRGSAELKKELNTLKEELRAMRAELQEVSSYQRDFPRLPTSSAGPSVSAGGYSTTSTNESAGGSATNISGGSRSFVDLSRDIATDPSAFKTVIRKKPKLVVGTSSTKHEVKAVRTIRAVDIFISRLHPETRADDLERCVRSTKNDFAVLDVTCDQLQSKYADLYVSFHVAIKVDSAYLQQAVKVFMSAETWPCGVFVKRYFKRKHE